MKKLIILAAILTSAVCNSQDLPTNKTEPDSVKVAVKDMDNAALKMIEGKKYKEKFQASQLALQACDEQKAVRDKKEAVLNADLSLLKKVNKNLRADATDYKIMLKNEKTANFRRGFIGIAAGFIAGSIITTVAIIAL